MFDAHNHWLPREIIDQAHFYSDAWGDIERQLALMDKFRIAQALLLYPTTDAYQKMGGLTEVARIYNDRIAEIVARYPGRFLGAAILPVDEPGAMLREFERAVKGLGFRAISIATSFNGGYPDEEGFGPLYEAAQKQNVPIFVHPQTINPIGFERVKDPLLTPVIEFVFDTTICIGKLMKSGVFRKFPDLKFVFAHFGGVMPFIKERFDSVYLMLRGRNIVEDLCSLPSEYLKQIYVDTSGVTSPSALTCTLDMVGADRILWGSDYPGNPDIAASVRIIEELDIPAEAKTKIFNTNAQRRLAETG
jgi:predicted TIM-barrel fold metal-dependent hydrolase